MKSIIKKIFGKDGSEYTEKISSQPINESKLKLEELNQNEIEYINNNIGLAEDLLKDLGLITSIESIEPNIIDNAIELWFTQDLETRFNIDVNTYSNSLASAWGKYLVDKLGMEWHVITDNYGTEVGLYHKNNNATIFPFNSTAKGFNKKIFDLIEIISVHLNIIDFQLYTI